MGEQRCYFGFISLLDNIFQFILHEESMASTQPVENWYFLYLAP